MKRILLALFLVACAMGVRAQEYMPFQSSTYSGVTGVTLNPASIADSRYKLDVTLFGASGNFHNNELGLYRNLIFKPSFVKDVIDYSSRSDQAFSTLRFFRDEYSDKIYRDTKDEKKSGIVIGEYQFLNAMYTINDRNAIAFTWRMRNYLNGDDANTSLLNTVFHYGSMNRAGVNGETRGLMASWDEYGLSYAHVFADKGKHFFKAGITGKLTYGRNAAYATADQVQYSAANAGNVNTFNFRDGRFAHVTDGGFGVGMDIGLVYEYRPHYAEYQYEMDGETGLWEPQADKYLFRVGLSLVDLGFARFDGKSYRVNGTANLNLRSVNSMGELENMLRAQGVLTQDSDGKINMSLPTALSAQFDWNLSRSVKGLYVNFTPYVALRQGYSKYEKIHTFTTMNLTPRWESKWFGVGVPIQYDQFSNVNVGLSLRLGPIWVGSSTILTNAFTKEKNYATDLHVLAKVPILRTKPKDRDNDAVSDKNDLCPDTPGPWATKGCPDRDGDGVIDAEDECPDVPGLKELRGCPDRDGDGVPDHLDRCPDQAGPKELQGCPDRDGDGIPDIDDRCPDQAGPKELQGCPDRDGDGVPDIDDACPDVPGPKENKGCPYAEEGPKYKNVEFAIDKWIITPSFASELDRVSEDLKAQPEAKAYVAGHTDNTYTHAHNMALSKRRAEAVQKYLVKKGIKSNRIVLSWFGPDRPIATNDTDEGRQKNRRSEVEVR